MKKIIIVFVIFCTTSILAQTQYEKGMTKAFELWEQNKNAEASQLFERIATAEKDNWLPSYYAATVEIVSCFGLRDETILSARLNKAKQFLDTASAISKNNPEIMITYALLNTAYIAFDGQKYGMTLSGKNAAIYSKALAIAPNNPRVVLGKAEWDIGGARFFGKSTMPFCKDIKRAIELFKNEKQTVKFYPTSGLKRAEQVLKDCQK